MKAISIWQPWATLLVHGMKRIETRGWFMNHRGPLAIHASKHWSKLQAHLCCTPTFSQALKACGVNLQPTDSAAKAAFGLPLGAIVGGVDVLACFRSADVRVHPDFKDGDPYKINDNSNSPAVWINPAEREFGDYGAGRFAILCQRPIVFDTPLPWKGMQGLFEVGDMPDLPKRGVCFKCGCTDADCRGCIKKTGRPCEWADAGHTLCTACVGVV